eukprot:TRINITY_DN5304_c0_g1_i1.p1 TRINITY_DN5304_c0_g1~~TRINITY_DN5304_c0_g1_i1.p1  ORF type:complete len:337 (+),score=60.46 TRINITY_DN5304_c0_g1_i1:32-1042(+)
MDSNAGYIALEDRGSRHSWDEYGPGSLSKAASTRLAIYKARLDDYVHGFRTEKKRTKICCGAALTLWIMLALATGVLLFMSLYYLPKQEAALQNMSQTSEFTFSGGSIPSGSPCTSVCQSSFACGKVTSTPWDLPSDWDPLLSYIDDVYLTVSYSSVGNQRVFLNVSSGNVLWRELEVPENVCGKCEQQTIFIHSVFHKNDGFPHPVWTPELKNNNFTLDGGDSVCFTQASLTLHYSKSLVDDFSVIVDGLYWGGLAAAGLTLLLPAAFCGHLMHACNKDSDKVEDNWVNDRLNSARRAERRKKEKSHKGHKGHNKKHEHEHESLMGYSGTIVHVH